MTLSITYITVPFLAVAGRLCPGTPRRSPSRTAALASAEKLAPSCAGVVVLRDCTDPAANVFPEPTLIYVIGDVPRDLLMRLAA